MIIIIEHILWRERWFFFQSNRVKSERKKKRYDWITAAWLASRSRVEHWWSGRRYCRVETTTNCFHFVEVFSTIIYATYLRVVWLKGTWWRLFSSNFGFFPTLVYNINWNIFFWNTARFLELYYTLEKIIICLNDYTKIHVGLMFFPRRAIESIETATYW